MNFTFLRSQLFDKNVATIVEAGFTSQQAMTSLKACNNDANQAVTMLLQEEEKNQDRERKDRDRRAPKTRNTRKDDSLNETTTHPPAGEF